MEKNMDIHKQDWAKQNIIPIIITFTDAKFVQKHGHNEWHQKVHKIIHVLGAREKRSHQKSLQEKPTQLSDLTQVEEMLIAKALPIMHIYIKQAGQRGYSGQISQSASKCQ